MCFWQNCSIKPEDVATVWSSQLLAKLRLEDLDLILRQRRLRWFGHVEHFSGAVNTACDIQIDGVGGGEAQAYMEETDGERLPWVEAQDSWPSRKEHLEIRFKICYTCSYPVTCILQYIRPSWNYNFPLRSLFCLFLSGCLRQVLQGGQHLAQL